MAQYREPDSNQSQIVVLNFDELFPEDHPVPGLLRLVRRLDLSDFDENYLNDNGRGGRTAVPPDRVLALLFYSILNGNISMRNLERDMRQRADLMYLSGGMNVDHTTLSVFRKRHAAALAKLFTQTVFLGVESGLIDMETIAIDSTKIKASANRRDIGTLEEMQRRYNHLETVCTKRLEEWQAAGQDDRPKLAEKLERLEYQKMRLEGGIEFLKSNPERKRVHLTDPDADWHKDGANQFIVGYAVQAAVDTASGMIVHQEVVRDQTDVVHTVSMIKAVEAIKAEILPAMDSEVQYVLDCGYASEANLRSLEGRDVYMPDREYARSIGGKTKPEDRKPDEIQTAAGAPDSLKFSYDPETDSFQCPAGETLSFKLEKPMKGTLYRQYRRSGCGRCAFQNTCAGPKKRARELWIQSNQRAGIKTKMIRPHGRQSGAFAPSGPLTLAMREKLGSARGRSIYAKRFSAVEPVFGIVKEVRNGWQFLRRGIDRVQVEGFERAIAHNLAKILGFRRVNEVAF